LLKPNGKGKLSKRDGDAGGFPVFPLEWKDPKTGDISSGYRESGYLPEAVNNMLALLGWHPSDNQELFTLDELVQAFSLEKVSKSGAKFDVDKARWFNHKYLQERSSEDIASLIASDIEARGWNPEANYLHQVIDMVKEKVNFAKDIPNVANFFFEEPTSYDEKVVRKKWKNDVPGLISELGDALAQVEEFTANSIQTAFEAFAASKEKSPGSIMQPMRLAVSGLAGGPPIFEMLELLGKDTVVRRLKTASEVIPSGE